VRKLGVATDVCCVAEENHAEFLQLISIYGEATKNANNSTNIYPFDLIRRWEHDTIYILKSH